jgi:hypothetical protein
VFVAKINAEGSALLYSTYLGGSRYGYGYEDEGFGIAVDGSGNALVTGSTSALDFPTVNALQPSNGTQGTSFDDAFVTKLSPSGSALIYSTYLGGSGNDYGQGIAVDAVGNAYVTGDTFSTNFPTSNALQPAPGGPPAFVDAFVAKISPSGSALLYSTYLGGSGFDRGNGIAVDGAGNAYVTGLTGSLNFPTMNPLQPANHAGIDGNAFVAKINAAGTALVYSTYLGGSGGDQGQGIAVDGSGNAYVTGYTGSTDFPTASPLQASNGGSRTSFVTKINATGLALVYSTYLGGSGGDEGQGIAVDSAGNAYVTGSTASTNFPTNQPLQANYGGGGDAFVAKIGASGSALVYSTYLGGSGSEGGGGIAVDALGNAYVTGGTGSTNFPTANALQASGGGGDAFVLAIGAGTAPSVTITTGSILPQGTVGTLYSQPLVASGGVTPYSWGLISGALPLGLSLSSGGVITGTPTSPGSSSFTVSVTDSALSSATQSFSLTIAPPVSSLAITTNPALPGGTLGAFYSQSLAASGGSPPYTWSLFSGALPLGLSLSSSGAITGIPTATGTSNFFVVRVTDTASAFATQTFLIAVSAATGASFVGSMPHIAAEENWITTFTLVNKQAGSAQAQLNFFGDAADPSGNGPLILPLTLPQQSSAAQPSPTSSFGQAISANASLIVQTAGPQTPPVEVGSAQLASTGDVDGFAIFHLIPGAQEAVVPMEKRNASSYLLAFDNTGGVVLGVAVANVSAQAGNVGIVIRDDTGTVINSGSMAIAANGHTSFVLSAQYPVTANRRGTIEFDTPAGGQISVLGIRTTPLGNSNTLTTIPALANVGTSGGSIAHIATGNGWQTTFVLVNAGAGAAQASLNFFADVTGAPLALPVSFPQLGSAVTTVNSVSQTLAAGASLVVQSAAPSANPTPTIGSAQLTTTGNVSGFVIFRYNPNGQEAVVPLQSVNANAYIVAFDNTAGTATGVAINSVSSQSVNVPVVIRDDAGNQLATDTLNLAANGHLAFTLGTDKYPATANIRGTIEFDTPPGAQIGALGIRIPVAHTFTTLPALVK